MAMFRQTVERCPDDVWVGGTFPRNTWRIAYHALAYAHLYLSENLDVWPKWNKHRLECTWLEGEEVPVMEAYTREEALEFVSLIESELKPRLYALDLGAAQCGFAWYPKVTRFELMILSLRHLHVHLGQISEILIANSVDVDWIGQVE